MRKLFNAVFNRPRADQKQSREQFINRMNIILQEIQYEFEYYKDYEGLVQEICFALGEDMNNYVYPGITGKRHFTGLQAIARKDFDRILMITIVCARTCRKRNYTGIYQVLVDKIQETINESEAPLGIQWQDDFFYPDPIPEIDQTLFNDNFAWLHKYPDARKDFQSALTNWQASRYNEVLTSLYRGLENIIQQFTSVPKALHDPALQTALLQQLQTNSNWKSFLVKFVEYANDYGRHGKNPGRHTIDPHELESYLFLCLTIVKLISRKNP